MDAFGTAKNSVKPVAAQPPALEVDDVLQAISDHGWGSYHAKVAEWQADSQANIEAFGAYHSASTTNGGQMPAQYAQLSDFGAPISMTTSERKAGTTDTGEWARNPSQTQVPAQDRQTARRDRTGGDREQPATQQNQQVQPNQQVQQNRPEPQTPVRPGSTGTTNTDNTHANSYLPKPVMPAAQGGYEFGPTGNFTGTGTGAGTGANWPGGFGPGTGTYTGGDYQPRTPGGSTGTGPGSRPGQPGLRPPGSSTGARLPEERFPNPARGAAGPRGSNGLPMATPMQGRGGKEEDREKKKAPYLQNPDPDGTFGGFTEKPMPPVIGEKKN